MNTVEDISSTLGDVHYWWGTSRCMCWVYHQCHGDICCYLSNMGDIMVHVTVYHE